ncbi:MAG: glycosyltransferase [Candidatus Nanopelagicales bacterium]|jgi:glycosyltransferase involved in cell wall biosynthesis
MESAKSEHLTGNPCDVPEYRRVLVISHEASRTGASRVAVTLLAVLNELDWNTTVVHRHGGPLRSELDAVSKATCNEPGWRLRGQLRRLGLGRLACGLENSAAESLLKRHRPDLVWANTVLTAPYVLAANKLGIPVVWYSHEQAQHTQHVLRRYKYRKPFREAELVACSSEASMALASELGLPVVAITTLHPSIDRASIMQRAAYVGHTNKRKITPIVLAVGVGSHAKGVDIFVAAAERASLLKSNAQWQWVGKRPASQSGHVEWLGEVSDPVPLMAAASVVVVPSRSEGFPLVVMEAMAAGTALVCSDLPGIREQLDGTGVLVPPGDDLALTEGVLMILNDDELRLRLGNAAQERSTSFSREAFLRDVASLSDMALSSRKTIDRINP